MPKGTKKRRVIGAKKAPVIDNSMMPKNDLAIPDGRTKFNTKVLDANITEQAVSHVAATTGVSIDTVFKIHQFQFAYIKEQLTNLEVVNMFHFGKFKPKAHIVFKALQEKLGEIKKLEARIDMINSMADGAVNAIASEMRELKKELKELYKEAEFYKQGLRNLGLISVNGMKL